MQEHWMKHFCEREELKELQKWMHEEGLSRPRGVLERVAHADKMRELTETWYGKKDARRALHCVLAAVHCLDFTPQEQMNQEEDVKERCVRVMLPILELAMKVFMLRGQLIQAEKAASAGLKISTKLPEKETAILRRTLHFNRGLVRGNPGEMRNLDGARDDLVAAAKLDPEDRKVWKSLDPSPQEIRECLANCKKLVKEQQRQSDDALRYRAPGEKKQDEQQEAVEVDDEPAEPPKPRELGAWELKFAEVVGKSLGKMLRCCKRAKQVAQPGIDMAAKSPKLTVATASVPLLGLLVHFWQRP